MKEKVKVSLVQFSAVWGDRETNIRRMAEMAEAEAAQGADLIQFPELSNLGYITPSVPACPVDFEDMSYEEAELKYFSQAETVPGPTTEALGEVASRYHCYIVVGITQKHPVIVGTFYNSAVLIGPEGIVGVHHKVHLPLEEKHYFVRGNTLDVYDTELGKIGLGVCYDARFPETARVLALKGAEIICNSWATFEPDTDGDDEAFSVDGVKYRTFTRSQENGVYFLSCNRSGEQGIHRFSGRSCVGAPSGAIIAESKTREEEVLRAELSGDAILRYRSMIPIYRDRRPELYGPIVQTMSEAWKG